MEKRKRRLDYDVIRIFACITILLIHFNASVCGWDIFGNFHYSNQLVPNFYFKNIYLGEIGNNLFFILSGAALCLNSRDTKLNFKGLKAFYYSRIKALLPAFWIAWVVVTLAQMLVFKTTYPAPWYSIIWTILGVDGYFGSRGWVSTFYQIGEWYLGCALLCYLIWPFVKWVWNKLPNWFFLSLILVVYIMTMEVRHGNSTSVVYRLCQMVAGGCFTRYVKTAKNRKLVAASIALTAACILLRSYIQVTTTAFVLCWTIFLLLSLMVECLPGFFEKHSETIRTLSSYTYPVFLVHHKIITTLAFRYDLSAFRYIDTVKLFFIYLVIVAVSAVILKKVTDITRKAFSNISLREELGIGKRNA